MPTGIRSPTLSGDLLVFDAEYYAIALDVYSGQEEWRVDPDEELAYSENAKQITLVTLVRNEIGRSRSLFALDAESGAVVWEYASTSLKAILLEGDMVFVGVEGAIVALDLHTGKTLWREGIDTAIEVYVASGQIP